MIIIYFKINSQRHGTSNIIFCPGNYRGSSLIFRRRTRFTFAPIRFGTDDRPSRKCRGDRSLGFATPELSKCSCQCRCAKTWSRQARHRRRDRSMHVDARPLPSGEVAASFCADWIEFDVAHARDTPSQVVRIRRTTGQVDRLEILA